MGGGGGFQWYNPVSWVEAGVDALGGGINAIGNALGGLDSGIPIISGISQLGQGMRDYSEPVSIAATLAGSAGTGMYASALSAAAEAAAAEQAAASAWGMANPGVMGTTPFAVDATLAPSTLSSTSLYSPTLAYDMAGSIATPGAATYGQFMPAGYGITSPMGTGALTEGLSPLYADPALEAFSSSLPAYDPYYNTTGLDPRIVFPDVKEFQVNQHLRVDPNEGPFKTDWGLEPGAYAPEIGGGGFNWANLLRGANSLYKLVGGGGSEGDSVGGYTPGETAYPGTKVNPGMITEFLNKQQDMRPSNLEAEAARLTPWSYMPDRTKMDKQVSGYYS